MYICGVYKKVMCRRGWFCFVAFNVSKWEFAASNQEGGYGEAKRGCGVAKISVV
jgi:hypothetical protein